MAGSQGTPPQHGAGPGSPPAGTSPTNPTSASPITVVPGGSPVASTTPDNPSNTAALTQQQRDFLLAQQERMRVAQQAQMSARPPVSATPGSSATSPFTPTTATPGVRPARPPPVDQRKQFLISLSNYHRISNSAPPPQVFNGERDGSVKVAGVWVDLVDLFMAVMRTGGSALLLKQPESDVWKNFLASKKIPDPLPEPTALPRPPNSDPAIVTGTITSAVEWLMAVYSAYLQGFEIHMAAHRQAVLKKQHAAQAGQMQARPPPPIVTNGQSLQAPSPASVPPPTPSIPSTPTSAPTAVPPSSSATSTPGPISNAQTTGIQSQMVSSSQQPYNTSGIKVEPTNVSQQSLGPTHKPSPIQTNGSFNSARSTPDTPSSGKKRKRDKKPDIIGSSASTPGSDAVTTPKRQRYKVEYQPLHLPMHPLGGWDERMIASTFPKNNIGHPSRPVHELGIVDMEAVLMSLRSRMPKELGYAITTLLMLSMPHPEEKVGGLPIMHIVEVYEEVLDLILEKTFGEIGWAEWNVTTAHNSLDKMSYFELERLGRNPDFADPRDITGGDTDVILSSLNLLRNFSMLLDNQAIMASHPMLFVVLARISDSRLCRIAGSEGPFSLLEFGRVRRDVVTILANLGAHVRLPSMPFDATLAIFRLLASFLSCGFETLLSLESPYGPHLSSRESPPPVLHSTYRALEAFSKLAGPDGNREVLGRVPSSELLSLFQSLMRLYPVTIRSREAMVTIEEFLGYTECLALSTYSLAFLAPLSVRTAMRSSPGASAVLTRIVFDTATRGPDFKANPFAVLCRRLCETLGVLNGTVAASGDAVRGMSFGSGAADGKGWKFASEIVQPGWLAAQEERLVEVAMGKGVDWVLLKELEGVWWGIN
ncbi:hypothetical protein BCR39DRAFT_463099 [Naematelia encephala]|uniref:ARID domain-containing protein n=1 Tax=Naematelia encephala TaxID=71784 RepID=A0A1Y2BH19_9TREE|nr:hypothetical protein BCR39DRAFT_463099 [Naematelia encephala]